MSGPRSKKGNQMTDSTTSTTIPDSDQKALTALDRYIATPPENSRVFTITPDMAADLLQRYNHHNRPPKPGHIGRYRNDMGANNWALTGDTIKFSDARLLRDGQNRLLACVEANASFRTHIVFGIPDAFFNMMDQGKNREGLDLLAIEGVKHPGDTASAVRWARLFTTDTVKKRTTFTQREIHALYMKGGYSGVSDFVVTAQRIRKVSHMPTGVVAGALYTFDQIDPRHAAAFAQAWESGKWVGAFKVFDTIQKRVKEIESAGTGRIRDDVRAALIVIAWNASRKKGKGTADAFRWEKGHTFPAIL
jgi:hypothetical protein